MRKNTKILENSDKICYTEIYEYCQEKRKRGRKMKKALLAFILMATMTFSGCVVSGSIDLSGGNISSSQNSSVGNPSDDNPNGGNGGANNSDHVDADKDDYCDDCGASVAVVFDFIALNDLHGKFADSDTQPGVDELSTFIKKAREENENTLLLSSGDMWQGSSESNLTQGMIVTEWMNEMDFDSMSIGNHEYDWGEACIEKNAEAAEFPFLGINIYEKTTNQRVEYCQPSVTVEKNGVKIGIIGAVGDCYSSIAVDNVQEIYFKTGSALTSLVKAEAQRLREEESVDFVVYSIHDGYGSSSSSTKTVSDSEISSYYDVALSGGYVDLVFEGHTHQRYVLKDSQGVYHLQDGGDNDGISHAEVKINFVNDTYVVQTAEFISTSVYSSLPDDPIVETLLQKYEKQIALSAKVLGQNSKKRSSTQLRQLVADLYYQAGVERWGSRYNIVLGGGFISVRSPYNLYAGEVIYGDLLSLFPFDNQLVLCSISGRNLKEKFFETTNSNYGISYGAYGQSVKDSINLNATYYVVVDTYCSSYKYNYLTEIERYDENVFARDLVAAYIEKGGMEG